jgi:hypothetical protein
VFVCVCVCVYIYIYIYIYIYPVKVRCVGQDRARIVCPCVCEFACTCVSVRVVGNICAYIHVWTHARVCIHACNMQANANIRIAEHTNVCVCARARVRACVRFYERVLRACIPVYVHVRNRLGSARSHA